MYMVSLEAPIVHGNISCSEIKAGPWKIQSNGHLIPNSNASFDIGNAEYKVRHLYLSDNSIQIGDTVLSEDSLKNTTRFVSQAPSLSTSPGSKGDIAQDNDHVYFCFADDNWCRVKKSTW